MLHQILPTQERVARTSRTANSFCKVNNCPGDIVENLPHALVHCSGNSGVGEMIVQRALTIAPSSTIDKLLQLELKVEGDDELALVWWLAAGFQALWDLRMAGKRVEPYLVRAQLEAKINLLRETTFTGAVPKLEGLLLGWK